jgi:hypothetical protein
MKVRLIIAIGLLGLFLVNAHPGYLQDSDVLPAPLYFLDSPTDEIWRMETDGATVTQITDEDAPVIQFDVSPENGALVFISDNDLIRANAAGDERTMLVDGENVAASAEEGEEYIQQVREQIRAVVWSPDGSQIAFAQGGIQVISSDGGEPELVLPNAIPDEEDPEIAFLSSVSYIPEAWSPDGTQLLINVLLPPESGGLEILSLEDGSRKALTNPDDGSMACCYPSWSIDSASVYYSVSNQFFTPGLWQAEAETGESETLIEGVNDQGTYRLIAYPRELVGFEGYLFSFATVTNDPDLNDIMPLTMYRLVPGVMNEDTPLRMDSYKLGEVLWAEDGSGAVIGDLTDFEDTTETDPPLVWLPTDGSPAVRLNVSGYNLRWGYE